MLDIHPDTVPIVRAHVQSSQTISRQLPENIAKEMQIWQAENNPPERAKSADRLAKLFSLENAIQMMMSSPGHSETHALNYAITNLPDQLGNTDEVKKLLAVHQLLFTSKSGKNLATRWFNAAVTPGTDNLMLAQATSDWTATIQRLRENPGLERNHLSPSDVSHNTHLPARTDVKQGSKKGKGWSNVTYNSEAGYQAVYQTMLATQAGNYISRSRAYPTIQDLE